MKSAFTVMELSKTALEAHNRLAEAHDKWVDVMAQMGKGPEEIGLASYAVFHAMVIRLTEKLKGRVSDDVWKHVAVVTHALLETGKSSAAEESPKAMA